jgi:hypothetical protein
MTRVCHVCISTIHWSARRSSSLVAVVRAAIIDKPFRTTCE